MEKKQSRGVSVLEKSIYHDNRTAYMVIKPGGEIEDTLSMNMMKNNDIDGFLNMDCRYVDNKMTIYYEIQGMQCLKEYIDEYGLDYNIVKQLYKDISKALSVGEEFFLNENSYILDLEYIYWDKRNKRAKLCCEPEWQEDFQDGIKKLTEEIITCINHKDKQAAGFMYGIYDLILAEGFNITGVEAYINGYKLDKSSLKNIHTSEKDTIKSDVSDKNNSLINEKEMASNIDISNQNKNITDKDITYIKNKDNIENYNKSNITKNEYGILNNESDLYRHIYGLLPIKDNNKENIIWLNKICNDEDRCCEINVGRCETCDIVIPCSYISRHHARIVIDNERLYISDEGSTNGTFINKDKISNDEATLCNSGDVITFADISYCVVVQ